MAGPDVAFEFGLIEKIVESIAGGHLDLDPSLVVINYGAKAGRTFTTHDVGGIITPGIQVDKGFTGTVGAFR